MCNVGDESYVGRASSLRDDRRWDPGENPASDEGLREGGQRQHCRVQTT